LAYTDVGKRVVSILTRRDANVIRNLQVLALLRRPTSWLCLGVVWIGLAVSFVRFALAKGGPPLVEMPAILDLGNRELGETVVVPFAIANRGGEMLVIDNVRTSCSCTGIERQEDGKFLTVERLEVNPGESAKLVMRVAIRGVPAGAATRVVVFCRTNDPTTPEARIEAVVTRVSAGVHATPKALAFGMVGVNEVIRKVIVIHDTATPPRVVDHVSTTMPGRVAAQLLPTEEWPRVAPGKLGKGGRDALASLKPFVATLWVTNPTR
jgi:hypothetical protein